MEEHLNKAGVKPIRKSPSMKRFPQLYVIDPDGNIVEINEWRELLS